MSITEWRAHRHGNGVVRADLGLFSANEDRYFDVFVVDPTAPSYQGAELGYLGEAEEAGGVLDGGMTAATLTAMGIVGNAAAAGAAVGRATADSPAVLAREASKKRAYRPVLGDAVDIPERLLLFGVEATGRLSTASARFLRGMAAATRDREGVTRFTAQVGAIIAKCNAQQILAWERHFVASSF
jgi:hypothetical protein